MTRQEHLLTCLGEECNEVAQRVSKTLRFSLIEVQPGQPLNNVERIEQEMTDLIAVWEMLREGSVLKPLSALAFNRAAIDAKKAQVEKFMRYAAEHGALIT